MILIVVEVLGEVFNNVVSELFFDVIIFVLNCNWFLDLFVFLIIWICWFVVIIF